ncbi:MAG: sulfatase [Anaerolineales bacterium]
MKDKISRRDFLKLMGVLPLSTIESWLMPSTPIKQAGIPQNVIIVVFDAFSAYNISLYGYQRETTPNLARLAERAVVYHNHYAGGNFTTPGTASLLTGTLPWTHRAFAYNASVDEAFVQKNLFSAFPDYYRLSYTHNPWVNTFLKQFRGNLDEYVKRNRLFLKNDFIIPTLFEEDEDIAIVSWLRAMRKKDNGYAYSLFLSRLYENYDQQLEKRFEDLKKFYPRGIPAASADSYFLLETAIDWFGEKVSTLPQPFLSYLHFLPPHDPYNTHRDFFGRFKDDGWTPEPKPLDVLLFKDDYSAQRAIQKRTQYDEFILYVDREFGRLFDYLESSGLLEDTWVILTSDHGEMFERGVIGHETPLLYEPVIRIPLVIFEPGRKTRLDIHTLTSAVDLLPTLLHVTGQQPIDWTEGIVMPPYGSATPGEDRSVYALEARNNNKYAPLSIATTALVKGQYKLTYFFGYQELGGKDRLELYDLEADPEELHDLSSSKEDTANEMLSELKEKLEEVDKPYR